MYCKGCGGGWDYPCECDSNAQEAAEEALQKQLDNGDFDDQIYSDLDLTDDDLGDQTTWAAYREEWYENNYDDLVTEWVKNARESAGDAKADAAESRAEMRREEGY